jgi:hypothetical protein
MNCRICNIILDDNNWLISRQNRNSYICKFCENNQNLKRYYKYNYKLNYKLLKNNVFEYYGGKCNFCNEDNQLLLSLDHLDGYGRKHRRSININSGTQFYKWVYKNKPDNLRLLCYNCNCKINMNKIILPILFSGNVCKYCGGIIYRNFVCSKCYQVNNRNRYIDLKIDIFNHYGGKCNRCSISNIEYLTIDHINNDGSSHRKIIGTEIYPWLKRNNYPKDNYQILCFNCNYLKRII